MLLLPDNVPLFNLTFFPTGEEPFTLGLRGIYEYSEVNKKIRKHEVSLLKGKGIQYGGSTLNNVPITVKGFTRSWDYIASILQQYFINPTEAKGVDEYIDISKEDMIFKDMNDKKYWVKWQDAPSVNETIYMGHNTAYEYTLSFRIICLYDETCNYPVTVGFTVTS